MKRKRTQSTNQTWCSVCKLWVADNRAQRDQHESGSKHKAAQAQLIKDIAQKNEKIRAARPATTEELPGSTYERRKQSVTEQMLECAVAINWNNQASSHAGHALPGSDGFAENTIRKEELRQTESKDDDDQHTICETAQLVDENGFPLPLHETLGSWTVVNDDDNDHGGSGKCEDEPSENNSRRVPGTGTKDEQEPSSAAPAFRKRKIASSKRRRQTRE